MDIIKCIDDKLIRTYEEIEKRESEKSDMVNLFTSLSNTMINQVISKYQTVIVEPQIESIIENSPTIIEYNGNKKWGGDDTHAYKIVKYFNSFPPGTRINWKILIRFFKMDGTNKSDITKITRALTILKKENVISMEEIPAIQEYWANGFIKTQM